jgi:hypothetical protein
MMIIDTSRNCLNFAGLLKSRGVEAVGRYYRDTTHPSWRIGAAEALELAGQGIKLFVVFEDRGRASDMILTKQQGTKDAASALNQAAAIGQPTGSTIYFAVEGLPNGYRKADLPKIRDYFSGVKQRVGDKYALGVYGDGIVCKTLIEEGFCKHAWLAEASHSFEGTIEFLSSGQWSLVQFGPLDISQGWNGLSVDFNCPNGDYGAFLAAPPIT